ncbi:ACP S-malonyltransferase [Streptomyces sp. NPDC046866]|uniref:ACP S-malonyltransferase n=1 Tax=Streptomyces sp. NPDC046866 TaxID=3154921 RepID=UPI00345228A6
MTTAMVFPGMGPVTFKELGRFLLMNSRAKELLAQADEALGYGLFEAFRTSEEAYSEAAQVAFMVACTALADWAAEELGAEPVVCAGPSFGEKPLIGWSGALDFPDAVRMTAGLARCTAAYFAAEHRDVVTQSFVRAPAGPLAELLASMSARGTWHEVSCLLDDGFQMISLHERDLEEFQRQLRAIGSLPLYTMRPPMHSSLFTGLRAAAAREVIDALPLRAPRLPVLADQDGRELTGAEELRAMLLDHFVQPVDWPAVLGALRARGVERLMIAGPDSLFGRVEGAVKDFEVVAADPRAALRVRSVA